MKEIIVQAQLELIVDEEDVGDVVAELENMRDNVQAIPLNLRVTTSGEKFRSFRVGARVYVKDGPPTVHDLDG